jgi:glycosyltransferase involved in cell wall biosynthesis
MRRKRKMPKPKSKSPKVCFLGTVYNGQAYLAETLESIRNQTLKDIEVIYVDDGSTDSTNDILQHFSTIDSRFRYVTLPSNRGISVAWNRGLQEVKAPVICIASADDIYVEERAALSYKALKSGHKDAFYGAYLRGDAQLKIMDGFLQDGSPAWIGETVPYKKGILDKKQTIAHGFMAIRTTMAKKVPYREDLRVGIDYPFLKDLEANKCRWCWTEDPLGIYRIHKGSVSFTRRREVNEATDVAGGQHE